MSATKFSAYRTRTSAGNRWSYQNYTHLLEPTGTYWNLLLKERSLCIIDPESRAWIIARTSEHRQRKDYVKVLRTPV